MKNRVPLIFIVGILLINVLSNSCKKDTSGLVNNLLPGGNWHLSSVLVNHILAGVTTTDTLNTTCDTTQIFTFNANNTCTYTNFDCNSNQAVAQGTWALTPNQLYLECNMTCKDSTGNNIKPFVNAQIVTLGEYSMVLQTGDFGTYYPANQKLTVIRYGFIRQNKP